MTAAPLLRVRNLSKRFRGADGGPVHALRSVGFEVGAGETLGIVGESGCGKTTLGRTLLRLIEPSDGEVWFENENILTLDRRALLRRRRQLQMIFQDPFGSLNPRHKVGWIVGEPLAIHGLGNRRQIRDKVVETLALVGLEKGAQDRYPHEFSGGQRQRIAIARAIVLEPKLVIADEPVSALDVSIQSQILNLLRTLQRALGLALVFISHDLAVVRHISDRVAVMYLGGIVESAETDALFHAPTHPYTQALLSAAPRATTAGRRRRIILEGELPDPAHPPAGCPFHPRCPQILDRCREEKPDLALRRIDGGDRRLACHLHPATPA